MPIRKGEDWGTSGPLPDDAPEADSDAAVAAAVRGGSTHVRPLAGDLARTIGVSPASLARPVATLLPCDLVAVELDGTAAGVAAAHVRVGRNLRRGIAVMNAAFVGAWNVAPRAHPGDGKLDVATFALGRVDWWKARRRLPSGAHVPHPQVEIRRHESFGIELPEPAPVSIDGVAAGSARAVRCTIMPDAVILGV